MLSTFADYENTIYALSVAEMNDIYHQMRTDITGDELAEELYKEDLLPKMIKYANIRASWATFSREKKMADDDHRTSCHDSVIRNLDMLVNYLRKQGKTAAWRDSLGDVSKDPVYRKRIGDFACYVAFLEALGER